MISRWLLSACIVFSVSASADEDVSKLAGKWQVDRVVVHGVERHLARAAALSLEVSGDASLLRGSLYSGNTHTLAFKVDGQRLERGCNVAGMLCSSTLVGLRVLQIEGGPTRSVEEIERGERAAADDEYLGKLFVENDAYWVVRPTGIMLGFVLADAQIELSRYVAPETSTAR